jgi:signal transduction histidine kinase
VSVADDVDLLADGVVAVDGGGTVVRANAAAARLLGLDGPAALVGAPAATVLPLRDDQGRDWWTCTRPLDGLASRTRLRPQPVSVPTPAGEVRLSLTGGFDRDDDRVVRRLVLSLRPAVDAPPAEDRIARVVAGAAHDLRSPLTGVKGFTATLLSRWDRLSEDNRRQLLDGVAADADRMAGLLGDLLDVCRAEVGELRLRTEPTPLGELLRSAVSAAEVPVHVVDVDAGVTVEVDLDRLRRALGALVADAVEPGRPVPVAARAQASGAVVSIGVTRTTADARPAAALGRTLAAAVVAAHGGTLDDDVPGVRYQVWLPAAALADSGADTPTSGADGRG